MFLMYTTAHAKIRKQCFEAFWYTHHLVSGPIVAILNNVWTGRRQLPSDLQTSFRTVPWLGWMVAGWNCRARRPDRRRSSS